MSGTLVLVRHGQSEWNKLNLFTGWKDPDLTELGVEEAHAAGQRLKAAGLRIDIAFTSKLLRAQRTLKIIQEEMGQSELEPIENPALNERDYGDLAGLNKDDAKEKWGKEQVHQWRRSYDTPPPNGESLKDTGARVWPYYFHDIQPHVLQGKTVLISAHGNSLRAMVMALEGMASDEILKYEIATGVPIVYKLNADSTIAEKTVLKAET